MNILYAPFEELSILSPGQDGGQNFQRKARNTHEELKKDIFVEKDGYIEAFVVNETSENVCYDNFSIQSTGPIVVQETHYSLSR
jgi:hypothetical protein